jgi:hypothetical protein
VTPLVIALALLVAACEDDNGGTGPVVPAAPTGVSVAVSGASLVVTWTAVTGATGYDVQRQEAVAGAAFADVATDQTGTSYTDDGAVAGTTYNYRVIAKNADGESNPSDPAVGMVPSNIEALSGTISTARTLNASKVYIIMGIVSVDDGASLTIPAGTELRGSTTVVPSAIMVRQGGQIFSNGTAADPVVFTSGNPVGQREAGDWGGVVVNGRSICNFLSATVDECVSEGVSGLYGQDPPVLDDNSGVITYTRIEFAGYEASFGNELNALTLNGVGSGTELHHIQTHIGLDDGFEWFGGTVDLKYALATGISDDSFDYSTGWQGRGQFWIAQQDPANSESDQGFEVDGNENDPDAQPYTDPTIYNVTLIGGGAGAANSDVGMLLRLGTAGDIYNAIVMGFQDSGVDIDDAETVGRFTVQNSIIGLNAVDVSGDGDGIDDPALLADVTWNNLIGSDPNLTAPYSLAAPDFRPAAGGNALTHPAATPPSDGFFTTPVAFIGGADPAEATPWYTGWTTTALN